MVIDSIEIRDELLDTPLVQYLVEMFSRSSSGSQLLTVTTWLSSNLFMHKPNFEKVKEIIPKAWNLLHVKVPEVVKYALKIFLSATLDSQEAIEYTFKNLNTIKVASFLSDKSIEMREIAIKILNNICTGTTEMVNEVIETNCLPIIKEMMRDNSNLAQSACSLVANIAAGDIDHIEELIVLKMFEEASKVVFDSKNALVFVTLKKNRLRKRRSG